MCISKIARTAADTLFPIGKHSHKEYNVWLEYQRKNAAQVLRYLGFSVVPSSQDPSSILKIFSCRNTPPRHQRVTNKSPTVQANYYHRDMANVTLLSIPKHASSREGLPESPKVYDTYPCRSQTQINMVWLEDVESIICVEQ
jgi:hypothetical protein